MIIHVNQENPCDVLVENGALDRVGAVIQPLFTPGSRALIISDTNVYPLYGARLEKSLSNAGFGASAFVFEAGEPQKQISTVIQMYEVMSEKGFTRSDFIVTLGGGTACDLGGFAAATFLCGIGYVQVPTSLLAQADAGVDGKTGVDLPFGKNLVGAYHLPRMVICDPETLSTLPDAYFADGMGEIIKYGCVMDEELFGRLERGEVIDRLEETVCRCVECKKILLEEGSKDESRRMTLNFGHTFGHAIEKLENFSGLSHGLAVGVGMVMAAEVGESFGITEAGTAERIRSVLESYEMPTQSGFEFSRVVEATARDKKSFGKQLQLVLPKKIGDCTVHPVDRSYLVLRYKIAAEQKRRRK